MAWIWSGQPEKQVQRTGRRAGCGCSVEPLACSAGLLAGSYQNRLLEDIPALASYFFAMLPETLLIMWVYYNNKRSTLAAILLHFSANFAGEALQLEQSAKIIQTLILTACAVTVVCVDRKTFGRA